MQNPYDLSSDPNFKKFFGQILTKSEIERKPMDKVKFNIYCAEIMGHVIYDRNFGDGSIRVKYKKDTAVFFYEPYDDLNQMADVVTELSMLNKFTPDYKALVNDLVLSIPLDIKQTFRDFIISTMEKDDG